MKLEEYILELESIHSINGVISIESDDETIFRQAFGFSSIEHSKLNTLETKFFLGSNTKLFTAVAIMQLVECEIFSLSTPIKSFFPQYRNHISDAITIHHLLSHTSGIENFVALDNFSDIQVTEIAQDKLLESFVCRTVQTNKSILLQ